MPTNDTAREPANQDARPARRWSTLALASAATTCAWLPLALMAHALANTLFARTFGTKIPIDDAHIVTSLGGGALVAPYFVPPHVAAIALAALAGGVFAAVRAPGIPPWWAALAALPFVLVVAGLGWNIVGVLGLATALVVAPAVAAVGAAIGNGRVKRG